MLSELKSYIPGEIWPAFANPYGAQILAYMYQLEKSQYLPPAELLEKQFLQINEIIRRSIRRVPYYKETLISAGFRKNQEVTPDLWHQVPVLTRNSVQKYQQKLLNSKIPSNHEPTNTIRTSGSTGTAIEVTTTKITNFLYRAFSLREHFWHKLYFPGKIAIIRYADKGKADYPGTQLSHWGITTAGIVNTGPAVMLRSSTDIALQAKFLLREEPDYFLNYPSNIEALAQYFIRKGLRLQKLRAIRTMGEVVGSKVRSLCQEAWGVPIIDMYTAQEAGYIALQCPDNEGNYHIQAENLYVEVVDDEGRPCQPGEIGRVLLTTLHNFAMPLIRYEIGDYAQVGEPCACGRGLPVLTRILGRRRNLLTLPSGEKTWPIMGFTTRLSAELSIQQLQFVQKSLRHIETRLVTERPLNKEEEHYLIATVQKKFNYPFKVTITYLESIPRSKGGKFEDFMSEIS